jgi:hypothetical protein
MQNAGRGSPISKHGKRKALQSRRISERCIDEKQLSSHGFEQAQFAKENCTFQCGEKLHAFHLRRVEFACVWYAVDFGSSFCKGELYLACISFVAL